MKYWVTRFSHPLRGLLYAVRHDPAIQIDLGLGIIGIPSLYVLCGSLSAHELLLIIFCWFFVVVTELQNTSIEIALDQVHPEHHEAIGRSKDLAAAAVVCAALFALVSVIFIISGRF